MLTTRTLWPFEGHFSATNIGQFKDDAEANALITPRYCAPYRLLA